MNIENIKVSKLVSAAVACGEAEARLLKKRYDRDMWDGGIVEIPARWYVASSLEEFCEEMIKLGVPPSRRVAKLGGGYEWVWELMANRYRVETSQS